MLCTYGKILTLEIYSEKCLDCRGICQRHIDTPLTPQATGKTSRLRLEHILEKFLRHVKTLSCLVTGLGIMGRNPTFPKDNLSSDSKALIPAQFGTFGSVKYIEVEGSNATIERAAEISFSDFPSS